MLDWLREIVVHELGGILFEGDARPRLRTAAVTDGRTTRRFVFGVAFAALSATLGALFDHAWLGVAGAVIILGAAVVRTLRGRRDDHTPRG